MRIPIDGTAIADSIQLFEPAWAERGAGTLSHAPRVAQNRPRATSWEARYKAFYPALMLLATGTGALPIDRALP